MKKIILILILLPLSLFIIKLHKGIGITTDSVDYLNCAYNLSKGRGFIVDVSPWYSDKDYSIYMHHAPLYPVLLYGFSKLVKNLLIGSKLLCIIFFIANAFLFIKIVEKITSLHNLSLIGLMLFCLNPGILQIHTTIWSEQPFLFFLFLSLICLKLYLENQRKKYLYYVMIFLSFCCLARYAGFAFFIPLLIFLIREEKNVKVKIFAILIPLLLLSPWFIRNRIVSGKFVTPNLCFHLPSFYHFNQLIKTIGSWFFPLYFKGSQIIGIGIFLFLVCLLIRYKSYLKSKYLKMLLWMIISYLIFIFTAITFALHDIPLDGRILSPIYCLFLLLILAIFDCPYFHLSVLKILRSKGLWLSLGALIILFSLLGERLFGGHTGFGVTQWILLIHGIIIAVISIFISKIKEHVAFLILFVIVNSVQGFDGLLQKWKGYECEKVIIPSEYVKAPVFSNNPYRFLFHMHKPAKTIPLKFIITENRPNENYLEELEKFKERVKKMKGIIVYFDTPTYFASLNDILKIDFKIVYKSNDVLILQ